MTMTTDRIAKSDLRKGSIVRISDDAVDALNASACRTADLLGVELHPRNVISYDEPVEVCDLFDRKSYCKPSRVGVIRVGTHLAGSIELRDIREILS